MGTININTKDYEDVISLFIMWFKTSKIQQVSISTMWLFKFWNFRALNTGICPVCINWPITIAYCPVIENKDKFRGHDTEICPVCINWPITIAYCPVINKDKFRGHDTEICPVCINWPITISNCPVINKDKFRGHDTDLSCLHQLTYHYIILSCLENKDKFRGHDTGICHVCINWPITIAEVMTLVFVMSVSTDLSP